MQGHQLVTSPTKPLNGHPAREAPPPCKFAYAEKDGQQKTSINIEHKKPDEFSDTLLVTSLWLRKDVGIPCGQPFTAGSDAAVVGVTSRHSLVKKDTAVRIGQITGLLWNSLQPRWSSPHRPSTCSLICPCICAGTRGVDRCTSCTPGDLRPRSPFVENETASRGELDRTGRLLPAC